jgi:hypothetical protein
MLKLLLSLALLAFIGFIVWRQMTAENKAAVKVAAKQATKDTLDINDDGKVNLKDVKAAAEKTATAAKNTVKRGRPKKKYGGKVKSDNS